MSECDEVCVEFSPPADCRVCVCVCVCVLLVCRVHAAAGGEDGSGSC